jgi:hypothetical protein
VGFDPFAPPPGFTPPIDPFASFDPNDPNAPALDPNTPAGTLPPPPPTQFDANGQPVQLPPPVFDEFGNDVTPPPPIISTNSFVGELPPPPPEGLCEDASCYGELPQGIRWVPTANCASTPAGCAPPPPDISAFDQNALAFQSPIGCVDAECYATSAQQALVGLPPAYIPPPPGCVNEQCLPAPLPIDESLQFDGGSGRVWILPIGCTGSVCEPPRGATVFIAPAGCNGSSHPSCSPGRFNHARFSQSLLALPLLSNTHFFILRSEPCQVPTLATIPIR